MMNMKNIIYRLSLLVFASLIFVSCEENEIPTIDVVNSRAIAGFSNATSSSTIIFNPAEDTENVITVGVSTISDQDRQVVVTLDEEATTLDASYYEISNLNPVIPAGEFTTDIIITTIASTDVPSGDSELVLKLESVESAEIIDGSVTDLNIGLNVKCPEVDMASIPGTYEVAVDDFGFIIHSDFEIVEGPGDNEFTIVNLSGHSNPDAGGDMNYDVVFSVNPESGSVSVEKQAAWHWDTFGGDPDYGTGSVEGTGLVLTCINQINFNLTHTVGAGSFGTYALQITKQ